MKSEKNLFIIIFIVFIAAAAVLLLRNNLGKGENSVNTENMTEQSADSDALSETESNGEGVGQGTESVIEEEPEIYFDTKSPIVERFVENIGTSGADFMFLSMFPVRTFNEDVLYDQMLAVAEILEVPLDSGMQLIEVLETVLKKPNTLNKVFLGIHTEGVWEQRTRPLNLSYESELLQEGYSWEAALVELAKRYPNITFETVLYYPNINTLTSMDQETIDGMADWYGYVAEILCQYEEVPNMHLFMPGCEEWLICNVDNYQDDMNLTVEVADELERLILCTYQFMVTQENVAEKCERLKQLVHTYRENPIAPQKQDCTYVFLGDSVIGNYSGSLSIPGVVSYMTGADVINCGYGGLAATKMSEEKAGLQDVIDMLLNETPDRDESSIGNENARRGIRQFWNAGFEKNTEKLVFFLSFGINDYMSGLPVYNAANDISCYKGALTKAVEDLQNAFPNAKIVLMTPNLIARGDFGTVAYEKGSPYIEYIKAVFAIGEEKELDVIDIYGAVTFTENEISKYLADLCHPNYDFRFLIGKIIRDHVTDK